jgi:uncharacterized membrane protein YccC
MVLTFWLLIFEVLLSYMSCRTVYYVVAPNRPLSDLPALIYRQLTNRLEMRCITYTQSNHGCADINPSYCT